MHYSERSAPLVAPCIPKCKCYKICNKKSHLPKKTP